LINFAAVNDTLELTSKELLNSYLITEPFEVNDNSNLTYSIIYGVKDSSVAIGTLSNSDNISFKVELIDNVTNTVLSEFNQVVQSKNSIVAYENLSYQVNTAGIGNRTVRIRLIVDPNFMDAKFSLSKIFSDGAPLSKSKFNEVNWRGLNTVDRYDLSQNYPNPFNPSTTIKFQIPKDSFVSLKVYDILGNEISTLINEQKAQGRYEVNFNASSLASGVYVYKIQAGGFISSKKMMLLK
ncbi:MAG TPA: T9SS type A sorting domain-containing protein, partial [Ignavibacteriaceae bacterium]